jgi:hypothetical protein
VVRGETSTGPFVANGHTLTLVTRTRGLRIGGPLAGLVHAQARPAYVEVLDTGGNRSVVRIHDMQRAVMSGVVGAALACALGIGIRRLYR